MSTRFKRRASLLAWVCALPLGGLLLVQSSPGQRAVLAPILTALVLTALFYGALLHNPETLPPDEIGTWYVASIAGYAILPVPATLAVGQTYTPLNDYHLYARQPTAGTAGRVAW